MNRKKIEIAFYSERTDNELIGFIISENLKDKELNIVFNWCMDCNKIGVAKYIINKIGIENLFAPHHKFQLAAFYGIYGIVEEMLNYKFITNELDSLKNVYLLTKKRYPKIAKIVMDKIIIQNRLKMVKNLLE